METFILDENYDYTCVKFLQGIADSQELGTKVIIYCAHASDKGDYFFGYEKYELAKQRLFSLLESNKKGSLIYFQFACGGKHLKHFLSLKQPSFSYYIDVDKDGNFIQGGDIAYALEYSFGFDEGKLTFKLDDPENLFLNKEDFVSIVDI